MPELERLTGWRVVATPEALDGARWLGGKGIDPARPGAGPGLVLRFAPDEAFGIGMSGVELDDPDAIVTAEAGFVGALLEADSLAGVVAHVDWAIPDGRDVLAQGKVGGVPAKLWLGSGGALLVTHAAYADELADRLGWRS